MQGSVHKVAYIPPCDNNATLPLGTHYFIDYNVRQFNTYPINNNREQGNIITQADPPSLRSNIQSPHPEDPPVSQTLPAVLAPDFVACCYKALHFLDLSHFE